MNVVLIASLVAIGLALAGVIADAFLKKAGVGPGYMNVKWFLVGSAIYVTTIFGWFYVMKTLKLTTVGVLYGVSSVLFLTLACVIFFREQLQAFEWAGIFFAILSIVLLSRFA